jgi:hypothetical protein
LEDYAASFDGLFTSLAQRRGFREYLTGLLLPWERNKTLTALAGAEPVVGAQDSAVQRLQFFLSEAAGTPRPSTPGGWSCWPPTHVALAGNLMEATGPAAGRLGAR